LAIDPLSLNKKAGSLEDRRHARFIQDTIKARPVAMQRDVSVKMWDGTDSPLCACKMRIGVLVYYEECSTDSKRFTNGA
jgi:hypothetical protein